jgi:uncharacterized protein (TIGR03790 family)
MESTPITTQALPAGTRIEEFVIERGLGAGGFGMTYLARDTSLDRHVVIKENLPVQFCFRDPSSLTVAPRHAQGDDVENFRWSLENFSKEAAMLASLDHPGIVKVLRRFEAFGTAYFVMPFVEGVALDELVKQRGGKPFSEDELRGLLERVLAALGYLHERGIYHRDIKPGNILITTEGIPVLIDFGSARQRLSERSMTVVESAGYTPFEQLQSRGNVGPWSDIYALGATLEKILTGDAPPKAMDRMRSDPRQPLTIRPDLHALYSAAFLTTIDKSLEVEETQRWQDAGEWLAGLRPTTIGEAATAPKIKPDHANAEPATTASTSSADIRPSKNTAISWIFAASAMLILASWALKWSGTLDPAPSVKNALQQEQEITSVESATKQERDEFDRSAKVEEQLKDPAIVAEAEEIGIPIESTEGGGFDKKSVAVLYNSAVSESRELAEFYRKSRSIPVENLIALDMPVTADISRDDYEKWILKPLRWEFESRRWWKRQKDAGGVTLPTINRIRVLVTMRGVPLRIQPVPKPAPKPGESPPAPDPKNPVAGRDEASVDSELAMFGVEVVPMDGVLQNKFYQSEKSISDANLPFLVLTARIDAPTLITCKRMIRDAVEIEKTGLWGRAYVDIANKFPQGDQWLETVVNANARAGIPTVVDRFNDTLPKNYPMTEAALYYGWFDWNVSGPFLNPMFRFRKGAVAMHLHAFSAEQLSDAMKNWSGALLERGSAVTVGNVYQPYLHLNHDFSILHQRLLDGYSWVEACWMAMPVTSWQGVVLGDPLYRPFLHFDGSGEKRNEDIEFRALRAAGIEWKTNPREMRKQLEEATERMKSGILAEAVGLDYTLTNRRSEAATWFRRAQEFYRGTPDKMRMDLHLVAANRANGEIGLAMSALKEAEKKYGSAPEVEAFGGWLDILTNSKPSVLDPKPEE